MQIECKGIDDVSASSSGIITVDLQQVDMSFLEDLESDEIVRNHNNEKLLEYMDADEVFTWIENNFDVIIKENK